MSDNNKNIMTGRHWPFKQNELTAGLRRHTGDPSLSIESIISIDLPERRPALGRVRGLRVEASGQLGDHHFDLVLKEPQNSARTGTVQDGIREVSLYAHLGDHLPVRTPPIFAYHNQGDWLIMGHLANGRASNQWSAAEYLLAIDQLVALHDRFWELEDFLAVYRWLRRPLSGDFAFLLQAAQNGLTELQNSKTFNRISHDQILMDAIEVILNNLEGINAFLQTSPSTLLHGDYWPGNIHIHSDGSLSVYDWEQAAIGPAILDLLKFIQTSQWWFNPLPIPENELIDHYKTRIKQNNGFSWKDKDWDKLWAYAAMWSFATGWVDLLAKIPDTLLDERFPEMEALFFEPIKQAVATYFPKK